MVILTSTSIISYQVLQHFCNHSLNGNFLRFSNSFVQSFNDNSMIPLRKSGQPFTDGSSKVFNIFNQCFNDFSSSSLIPLIIPSMNFSSRYFNKFNQSFNDFSSRSLIIQIIPSMNFSSRSFNTCDQSFNDSSLRAFSTLSYQCYSFCTAPIYSILLYHHVLLDIFYIFYMISHCSSYQIFIFMDNVLNFPCFLIL